MRTNKLKAAITMSKPSNTLTTIQNISYALPILPHYMLIAPMAMIPGIYAKHYGIALTILATIIFLSRIIDAVTDPIVGYYSDRYRATYGTRKPFMIIGGIMILICGFFLYAPPGKVTALYLGFWYITFYIGFTLFEIPHTTWPYDLTYASETRAKIYSYRAATVYGGYVLFFNIPLLPIFETNEITLETLKVTFLIALCLALPFLVQCLHTIPDGGLTLLPRKLEQTSEMGSLFKEVSDNRPFLIIILALVFALFGQGMWFGLIYIYVDTYLGMGEQFAKMFLVAFIVGIVVTPLWYRLALKIGKKYTWAFATSLAFISYSQTGFLQPGDTTFFQLLILKTIHTCAFSAGTVLVPAMVAETVDYTCWKFNSGKSAVYFSLRVFIEKTSLALGIAAGLAIAGWFGFDAAATLHSRESIMGLQIAMVWIPILMTVIALVFILIYGFNESRHRIVRKRLEARQARADQLTVSPPTNISHDISELRSSKILDKT